MAERLPRVNIGVIGLGTVGSGVVRTLLEKPRLLQERVGARLVLRRVCDRNLRRARALRLPPGLITTDARRVLEDPEIQIVVELIGGIHPAKEFVLEALRCGKHVVTANKALLAEEGQELFSVADRHAVDLYFEASVGGGIPIIKALREGLIANDVDTILGIVNGTSNYILTQMRERSLSFAAALDEAQKKGYAERNPTLDISGMDSAHKLAILALLGFGKAVVPSQIYVEGIQAISQADIQYAQDFGYVIKLLAIAKRVDHELELRVHPTLLAREHLLSNVNGVYNAIYVHGDLVGGELFYGRGAGQNPTASAVISDIADLARNLATCVTKRVPHFSHDDRIRRLRSIEDVESRYYIRCSVIDKPGGLAKITGILGRHHISIASVLQKERKAARIVPVVLMTHEATERQMRAALAEIDRLAAVRRASVAIRTEAPQQR